MELDLNISIDEDEDDYFRFDEYFMVLVLLKEILKYVVKVSRLEFIV